MGLATVVNVETVNGLERTVAIKAAASLYSAEQTIRQWIGDAKYEDMASAGSAAAYLTAESNRTYADTEYTNTVQAEAMLAFAYALPRLNMRITSQGGLVRNLGLDSMGNANLLMSKRELDSYTREITTQARALMREMIYHGNISEESRGGETFVL